jgi:hypothetical protein
MAAIEYTQGTHTCDTCKTQSKGGFFWLDRDVPVLFDCGKCAERNIYPIQRIEALNTYIDTHLKLWEAE